MKTRMESSVASAQRLQLALVGRFEYLDFEQFEIDFDNVVALLEEVNDELKPTLEQRARHQAT